ncbi:amino acid ABC transporter permease [Xinfangfangia sp. CPCC 101601]|uniref:Amino acid ABC transporter permease n=1 Tax=Pseudogemmobacter lacusdianii TaxID=3069608 RepID=A0ABU0W2D7_9RHOB|nr:amino acid ABC transporter permease [Xinfangfangia sp. CPCC 101601]MDQ2068136.1 amino acid ABC transporter permease [Xinfangfangia sp. CPCC 101601]
MAEAAWMTVQLFAVTLILGLIVASVLTWAGFSRSALLRGFARVYISIMRGTPLLVQLFVLYFGGPQLGLSLDAFTAGCICFGLNIGAYISVGMRGAILAVSPGQTEAARALGFGRAQTMRFFILPQAAPLILRSVGVNAVILLKSTALVSAIGVVELTAAGQRFANATYQPFEALGVAAVFYLALTYLVTGGVALLERRFGVEEGKPS